MNISTLNPLTIRVISSTTSSVSLYFPYVHIFYSRQAVRLNIYYENVTGTATGQYLDQQVEEWSEFRATGLQPDTQYNFYFTIRNIVLNTTSSNSEKVSAWTIPSDPTITYNADTSFTTLSITDSAAEQNVSNLYVCTFIPSTGTPISTYGISSVLNITNLSNGTSYSTTVKKKNKYSFYSSPTPTISKSLLFAPVVQYAKSVVSGVEIDVSPDVFNGYKLYKFPSSGKIKFNYSTTAYVLIVAGGGGGGFCINYYEGGGGGGAGGVGMGTIVFPQNVEYAITVGAGGVGGTSTSSATSGSDSSIVGGNLTTAINEVSYGGGYGGGQYNSKFAGSNGGSGGGALGTVNKSGGSASRGSSLSSVSVSMRYYGNNGGFAGDESGGSGGGGAGATGGATASLNHNIVGAGGAGITWSVAGVQYGNNYYGGGGGGGTFKSTPSVNSSLGGSSVGGNGGNSKTSSSIENSGRDAVANTGSGGGGSCGMPASGSKGGNGSDGIIIIAIDAL